MGQIVVVGPQQMQNVTATGRKDGGAATGKSGDDGDSAIVSDGERERDREREREREATAPTHPLARVHGHNVTFITHSTRTNLKMDLEC